MLKKVLTVSAAMAILYVAKSQDLTQTTSSDLNASTESKVKINVNDGKGSPTNDPTTNVVGTTEVKKVSDKPKKLVSDFVQAAIEKSNDEGEELYRVYSEKGTGAMYRKKKFRDSIPHSADPFAWGDFSWMNGQSRKTSAPAFDSKYFTGDVTFDLNSTYSFADPIDNTVVGSTAVARNNELQLSFAGFGGDIHYGNIRGRIMMQFGNRSTVVPRNDLSSYKGQYDMQTIYRYISEAYAGYHWDKWHGINLDAGIFMSYIGLFSYNNFENWGYQPSFTSDNTPWFFNGVRLQTFPTDRLKVEFWLVNGWQSYGTFNHTPGIGASIYYRPTESIAWVFNNYTGHDDVLAPTRLRYHLDYSFLNRYYNVPGKKGLNKAAFSVTTDFGGESGAGVSPFGHKAGTVAQNFISAMAYNRLWFGNHFAWTIGGGFMHNPGQYLILAPTGYADTLFQQQTGLGSTFDAWDGTTTFEWDVTQNLTLKLEYVHRHLIDMHAAKGAANLPGTNSPDMQGYFAGHGGVTGPGGYQLGSGYTYASSGGAVAPSLASQGGWMPDLSNNDNRAILALLVRF